MPIFMYQPAIDNLGIQPPVDGGVRSDEGPEEDVTFYYGKMLPAVQDDGLAVDPNNPNTDVDGRDFLAWQRGYATDDGLLLPAVQDDGLLLPAVQDDGLLLPAVEIVHEGYWL